MGFNSGFKGLNMNTMVWHSNSSTQ